MFTELTTVTTHQVTLLFTDEADARDFLANPEKAQDAVRAQLASVHANGNGTPHDAVGMPKPARKTAAKRTAPSKKVGGQNLKSIKLMKRQKALRITARNATTSHSRLLASWRATSGKCTAASSRLRQPSRERTGIS